MFRINEKELDLNNLWSNEKKHFRIWIILFIIFWSLITILAIVPSLHILANKTQWTEIYKEYEKGLPNPPTGTNYDRVWITSVFLSMLITALLPALTISFTLSSVKKSYKKNNFIHLSSGALFFSKFHGVLSLIGLILLLTTQSFTLNSEFNVVDLVVRICVLVLSTFQLLFIARNVTSIKRFFVLEKLRKDSAVFLEQINKNMQDGNFNNNPFGMMNQEVFKNKEQNSNQDDNDAAKETKPTQKTKKDLAIEKILELPKEQLNRMAEKLNIFGFEQMTKEELANLIYNHTKKQEDQ